MSTARKKRSVKKLAMPARSAVAVEPGALTAEIRRLIEAARQRVAQAVNAGLTMLYWQIGTRIRQDIRKKKRAEYGEEILPTLSAELVPEFGRGFGRRNLFNMIRFAEVFHDLKIVQSLIAQFWPYSQDLTCYARYGGRRRKPCLELGRNSGFSDLGHLL